MNSFGRYFRVSIFGESHGPAIGIVMDGVPAGIPLSEDDFTEDIDRRRSGGDGTTPRREPDCPEILSGVHDGFTTGAPLTVIIKNENVHSSDYDLFRDMPRPGHADRAASVKWNGYNDMRGGGHFSGRLTLPIVAAGVVAKKILCRNAMIPINARCIEIGGIDFSSGMKIMYICDNIEASEPSDTCRFGPCEECPSRSAVEVLPIPVIAAIERAMEAGDSLGGVVECVVEGLPAGLGEPFFDSVESLISHAVFAIPGVRGIEFGDGFRASKMKGSEHNDPIGKDGLPQKNGAGGINGGITNGAPVVFRVALKPTSSIRKKQHTMNFAKGEMSDLSVPGRHDSCFALRAPVVVEAMTAIVLADLVLLSCNSL